MAGRDPWLAGPDTGPRPVQAPAGAVVVGVRLRPGAAAAILKAGVDQVTNRSVPLSDVTTLASIEQVRDALGRSCGPKTAARAVTEGIDRAIPLDWSPDEVVVAALGRIRARRSIEGLGLSARQLRRRFTTAVGYGPAFYRRVVRLDRFTDLLTERSTATIAELAAEAGYFDEAHAWRDCGALTGRTPAEMRSSV